MRTGRGDRDGTEPGRGSKPDRTVAGGDPDLIGDIGDLRRAAARLGELGVAEFASLAAALAAIERDLAASDPRHPDGRRLRQDLKARLDDLGEALRRIVDVVDRLRSRPI